MTKFRLVCIFPTMPAYCWASIGGTCFDNRSGNNGCGEGEYSYAEHRNEAST